MGQSVVGKCSTAKEALLSVHSGQSVFVHGAAATPGVLLQGLVESASRLQNVELIHLHTEGKASYAAKEFAPNFKVTSLFFGHNIRSEFGRGSVDYLPCFLSEIPKLFLSKKRPVQVALLHLSPPDAHGFCTLGTSVDIAKAAMQSADLIIAQINRQMPKVHGDGFVHMNELDQFIEVDESLPIPSVHLPTDEEMKIGRFAAALVEDGSCLQVGVGAIPNAVLRELKNHRHLGVHTETWSDGVLELLKNGVVDNSCKKVHQGLTVSGFIQGTQKVYDFINDNPSIIQLGSDYVNNPYIVARNPKAVAINSAVEIDLTGQVCADSVGHRIISGVGGQVDFARGVQQSEGGKNIIAMTSRTKKGESKIVAELKPGAGVVTSRALVQYVVTEFGAVDLSGKTLNERAKLLIGIAHPEFRENLEKAWAAIYS